MALIRSLFRYPHLGAVFAATFYLFVGCAKPAPSNECDFPTQAELEWFQTQISQAVETDDELVRLRRFLDEYRDTIEGFEETVPGKYVPGPGGWSLAASATTNAFIMGFGDSVSLTTFGEKSAGLILEDYRTVLALGGELALEFAAFSNDPGGGGRVYEYSKMGPWIYDNVTQTDPCTPGCGGVREMSPWGERVTTDHGWELTLNLPHDRLQATLRRERTEAGPHETLQVVFNGAPRTADCPEAATNLDKLWPSVKGLLEHEFWRAQARRLAVDLDAAL